MAIDSPFFLTKVECPICKTVNEYETVRLGAYVENGRDTDFCPRDITWRFPRYQTYHPLVFFIATCSNCFYSREITSNFKDWKNDHNFRTYRLRNIKEKHLDQLATADSFVKKLGEAIDIARFPNESGILKLHLAIFDELLCEHHSQLDVARFYLRIAWIFRNLEQSENPRGAFLRGLLQEIDTKYHLTEDTQQALQNRIDEFAQSINMSFDTEDIAAELKSQVYPYRDKFAAILSVLNDSLLQVKQKLDDLGQLVGEYKSVNFSTDGSGTGAGFEGHRSFEEFLLDVKKSWRAVVTNEHEAMKKAADFYKRAFTEGRDIAPGNQQIQAAYLIAELSRRVGRYEEARQYFNATIRHGQEFIHKNRHDPTQTALARKILELAIEQGKTNMEAMKSLEKTGAM
ncbi:MAG: DUF2225 domain-containing protein [Candidatus Zixiibacteriota bacterium]